MVNTILKSYETWITAQTQKSMGRNRGIDNISLHGINRLRELILELAVHGKLTHQNSEDESAAVLLEKIQTEKTRLIDVGVIKKQKSIPDIDKEEIPYILPSGWEWTRLDSISPMSIIDGDWIETKDQDSNGNIRLIQLADIGEGYFIDKSNKFINENAFNRLKCTELEENDLLIARLPSPIGRCCKFPGFDQKCITAVDVAILRSRGMFNEDYIVNLINSRTFRSQVESFGKGVTRFRISTGNLKTILCPLPPLTEQHRIVAKVDELMALCDKLEQQQTNSLETHQLLVDTLLKTLTDAKDAAELNQAWNTIESNFSLLFTTEESVDLLKQTILQLAVMGKLTQDFRKRNPELVSGVNSARELLKKIAAEKKKLIAEGKIKKQAHLPEITDYEKLSEMPEGWEWCRLGTFTIVGTGSTPSRDKLAYFEPKEFHWVTSGETNQDFIYNTNEKISSLAIKETNVSIYPKGSLIIAMYGQGKTRGQISELMIEAGTNQACAAVVLINKEESHRKYVKYFFKKAYEELRSHSAGGAQPNLNLGKVANTVIPIPPLSEQHRIVTKVDELFAFCDSLKVRIDESQEIKVKLADAVVEVAVKEKPAGKVIYTVNEQLSLAAEPE